MWAMMWPRVSGLQTRPAAAQADSEWQPEWQPEPEWQTRTSLSDWAASVNLRLGVTLTALSANVGSTASAVMLVIAAGPLPVAPRRALSGRLGALHSCTELRLSMLTPGPASPPAKLGARA
jgi:hypothetical protein